MRLIYDQIIEKCIRMKLLPSDFHLERKNEELCDHELATALLPAINKLLDKGLFELYQVLYVIDVHEEEIKERIHQLENTTLIPSIIAFAIIDRLKRRYHYYQTLHDPENQIHR